MIKHRFPADEIQLLEPAASLQRGDFDTLSGFVATRTPENSGRESNTLCMMIPTGHLVG